MRIIYNKLTSFLFYNFNFLLKLVSKKSILLVGPDKISWVGIDISGLTRGLNKGLLHVELYSTSYEIDEIQKEIPRIYKNINIDEAISYSLCVELEIMPWQFDPINEVHVKARRKWGNIAIKIIDDLLKKITQKKPNIIVYLQGYILEANTSLQIARLLNIKTLAVEMTFNSEKIIMEEKTGIAVNYTSAKTYYNKYLHIISETKVEDWFNTKWKEIQGKKHSDHKSNNSTPPFQDDYLLYLGQVFTDSSSLFGLSPLFRDQAHIIKFLIDYSKKEKKKLIIKLHPKEKDGLDPVIVQRLEKLTYRKLHELSSLEDIDESSIIVDSENMYQTNHLISNCKTIITINSQAGLEATVQNKPVILCGHSFYDNLGFTRSVSSYEELENALNSDVDNLYISKKAKEFIYIYMNYFCIDKTKFLEKLKSIT